MSFRGGTSSGPADLARGAAPVALRSVSTRIVVGAGFAGLAAGARGCERGGEVVVLGGARPNRGRVHSETREGVVFDTEVSRTHVFRGNPMTELVDVSGGGRVRTDEDGRQDFDADGREWTGAALEAPFVLLEEVRVALADTAATPSLAAAIDRGAPTRGLTAAHRREHDHVVHVTHDHGCPASAGDHSSTRQDKNDDLRGDDAVVPNGLARIAAQLSAGLELGRSRPVTCDERRRAKACCRGRSRAS